MSFSVGQLWRSPKGNSLLVVRVESTRAFALHSSGRVVDLEHSRLAQEAGAYFFASTWYKLVR